MKQKIGEESRPWLDRPTRMVISSGFALLTTSSCLYDADQRCGEHQVIRQDEGEEYCACDDQSVSTAEGCIPCGKNEEPKDDRCECVSGYARSEEDDPCTKCDENEVAGSDGCECAPGYARTDDDSQCMACGMDGGVSCQSDAPADECEGDSCDSDEQSPTDGCTTDDDCEGDAACDSSGLCRERPEGLGTPCASADDCADTEATFCDVVVSQTCIVEGCDVDGDDCFPGYVCCDLSAFGLPTTICAEGSCL